MPPRKARPPLMEYPLGAFKFTRRTDGTLSIAVKVGLDWYHGTLESHELMKLREFLSD